MKSQEIVKWILSGNPGLNLWFVCLKILSPETVVV